MSKLPLKREFPQTTLPFSVRQVLDYFNEAFGKRPFKIDGKSFVYTDRDNPDEVAIITVSDLEASLGVVLLATGDYGVNYMRKYFEAPFFFRSESEQLYILLDSDLGIRSAALDRFSVQMRISEAGRWLVVALEFSPSELYRPQLTLVTSPRRDPWTIINFRKMGGNNRNRHAS